MLDPDSFDSFDAFQEARLKEGLSRGWKPYSVTFRISKLSKKIKEAGSAFVNKSSRINKRR